LFFFSLDRSPAGSAICLIPSVQPLFQQLGLLDEIKKLAKPFGAMVFREGDLEVIGTYSSQKPLDIKERYVGQSLLVFFFFGSRRKKRMASFFAKEGSYNTHTLVLLCVDRLISPPQIWRVLSDHCKEGPQCTFG